VTSLAPNLSPTSAESKRLALSVNGPTGERRVQDPSDEQRLGLAYQAASLIAEGDSPEVVQLWFQGLNPQLEDRSPARLLREGDLDEVGPAVLTAARAFSAHG